MARASFLRLQLVDNPQNIDFRPSFLDFPLFHFINNVAARRELSTRRRKAERFAPVRSRNCVPDDRVLFVAKKVGDGELRVRESIVIKLNCLPDPLDALRLIAADWVRVKPIGTENALQKGLVVLFVPAVFIPNTDGFHVFFCGLCFSGGRAIGQKEGSKKDDREGRNALHNNVLFGEKIWMGRFGVLGKKRTMIFLSHQNKKWVVVCR